MGTPSHDNPLLRLAALGQSIWLDDLRRSWLEDGTLARLIAEDGLAGVTSNPAIFHKAIAESCDYDAAIATLAERGADASAIYENLVVEDVRHAADLLERIYKECSRRDGYVSLEVSPHLAHDTEATVSEAVRLWTRVDRPNLMIKVPGTRAGLPAIRRLIAAGINVNVTLLFSVARYREVADAYVAGLEEYGAAGQPLDRIGSVASFFVSRIDTLIDGRLDQFDTALARALRGQAAIACARLAYQEYKTRVASPQWRELAARGARPQRLLWASTGTKDGRYDDVKYVEALIGPDTVNTVPFATLASFRDHGRPALRLEDELDEARQVPRQLARLGIELEPLTQQLEDEGVRKFIEPFDELHATLGRRARASKGAAAGEIEVRR